MEHLNLSRRPFLNTRPVTRVSLLLWVLGALLLVGNVTLFWSYLSGSTDKREELARMEEQVERERESVGRLQARLAGLDLEQQNDQVEFLNRKIAERTFSWSLLFDRLAETMPDNVRLNQLRPGAIAEGVPQRSRRRTASGSPAPLASDRVPLVIAAEAKTDEEILQFVDNLFAHPSFDNPNLLQESRSDEGNRVQFSLRVTYLPRSPTPGVTVEEEEVPQVEETGTPAAPAEPSPDEEPETE